MDEKETQRQDNSLSSLEERRLLSEIQRNECEARKFEAETNNLGRLWSPVRFIQMVVGGIVAAGLFAAWFTGYFQPILKAESNLARAELKKIEAENEFKSYQLSIKSLGLQLENKRLVKENKFLGTKQEEALELAANLKDEVSKVSMQLTSTSASAKEYQTKYKDMLAKYDEAVSEYIKKLEIAKKETTSRIGNLERRDATVRLTGVGGKAGMGGFAENNVSFAEDSVTFGEDSVSFGQSGNNNKLPGYLADGAGNQIVDSAGNPIKDGSGQTRTGVSGKGQLGTLGNGASDKQ